MFLHAFRQKIGEFIMDPRGLQRRAREERARMWTALEGDRDIEWSWSAAHMPPGPGEALEFGPGQSHLSLTAAQRGYNVLAVDLTEERWQYTHPRIRYQQGDLTTLDLPEAAFDLIINCSTVEHVGLPGRYGVEEQNAGGDLDAMKKLRALIRPTGVMVMTVPVGKDAVVIPVHRAYGAKRLPLLLEGWRVEAEQYWTRTPPAKWKQVPREAALATDVTADRYGLGLFVLRRAGGDGARKNA